MSGHTCTPVCGRVIELAGQFVRSFGTMLTVNVARMIREGASS